LVGRLAGALAHDFNNILTAVLGYSEMLLSEVDGDHPWRADLEEILTAGQRAARLTRQLLLFNRQAGRLPQLLSWSRLIEEAEPLLARVAGERVRLEVHCDASADALEAIVDKGEASELIFQLAWLARAVAGGGLCRIEVIRAPGAEPDEARAELRWTFFPAGPLAADAEPDVASEEHRARAATLAEIAELVALSGGACRVTDSGTGRGWSVACSWALAALPQAAGAPAPQVPSGSGRTVLLVDDEDLLRQVVRRMLEWQGIAVIEASTGDEALAALERDTAPIDLLVTDVVMPGMSGPELARQVTSRRPGVRVLYVSGYTDGATLDLQDARLRSAFLAKPFSHEELIGAIDGLMA
jgi:CheY-like chemotaxis protein